MFSLNICCVSFFLFFFGNALLKMRNSVEFFNSPPSNFLLECCMFVDEGLGLLQVIRKLV